MNGGAAVLYMPWSTRACQRSGAGSGACQWGRPRLHDRVGRRRNAYGDDQYGWAGGDCRRTVGHSGHFKADRARQPQSSALSAGGALRRGALPMTVCLLLLPFAKRWRKESRRMSLMTWAVIVGLSLTMVAGLTGCNQQNPSKQTYSLTITATSGTLTHSTTATLIEN